VQVEPIKPVLKPPGTKRLNLNCEEPLSNDALIFKLRRYNSVEHADLREEVATAATDPVVKIWNAFKPFSLKGVLAGHSAGTYTRPLLSSTSAILVTPPCVQLSNRLGERHAPDVSHKLCLR
jgi:hypothetical protein